MQPTQNGNAECPRQAYLPSHEEAWKQRDETVEKGLAELRAAKAEAERRGVPLHEIIPVN